MQKTQTTIIICLITAVVALSSGVFIGRFTSPAPDIVPVIQKEVEVREVISADMTNERIANLLRQVDQLQDENIKFRREAEKPNVSLEEHFIAPATTETAEAAPRRWGRLSDEELAALQTTDPERYAAEIAAREEREAQRNEWLENRRVAEESRDNFFANLNRDRMNRRDRETLDSFVTDYQNMRYLMENGGVNADGERVDPMQMMQLGMNIATKADEARKAVLRTYGSEIGFNRRESEQFADKITEVYDATSLLGPGGAANIGRMIQQGGGRAGGGGGGGMLFNVQPQGGGRRARGE